MFKSNTLTAGIVALSAALSLNAQAQEVPRSVVVTQSEERALFGLWLLSDWIQQDFAHFTIIEKHDVSWVDVFTDENLVGVDVVYISPGLEELVLADEEVDALEKFAFEGGRLVIPGDYGMFADAFAPIAERFDVTYGKKIINVVKVALPELPNNPVMNGPEGVVNAFSGSAVNGALTSTNPDFQIVATWDSGPTAVGYIEHGAGEVIFLTDFNTWDNDMWFDHDNFTLWLNLFALPICVGDLDGDDVVGAADLIVLLGSWGDCDECPGDINGDGNVGTADLLELLGAWGACP